MEKPPNENETYHDFVQSDEEFEEQKTTGKPHVANPSEDIVESIEESIEDSVMKCNDSSFSNVSSSMSTYTKNVMLENELHDLKKTQHYFYKLQTYN